MRHDHASLKQINICEEKKGFPTHRERSKRLIVSSSVMYRNTISESYSKKHEEKIMNQEIC